MTRGRYIKHVVGSEAEEGGGGGACYEGGDFVSEEEEEDNSNDSWTTLEEFSSDYIYRYGSRYNEFLFIYYHEKCHSSSSFLWLDKF